jgi:putative methyltransferase (TIGR04325 family)
MFYILEIPKMRNQFTRLFEYLPGLFFRAYDFRGNFKTWEQALRKSTGYNNKLIFNKVKKTALLAKNGKIAFERDSVAFKESEYSWPLLAILLRIHYKKSNKINLIEFGGSLGSSYYQHSIFLKEVFSEVRWNIVEQEGFVKIGKKYFSSRNLRFYYDLDTCVKKTNAKILLTSSCVGYIEDPFLLIKKIKSYGFTDIIIDRTNFIQDQNHRLTIQKVYPKIYNASYPCWLFNIDKFTKMFSPEYKTISIFPSYDKGSGMVGGKKYISQGIWFQLIEPA